MAWEWVSPIATATAGVAGIVFTWLTGKQARDDTRAIAREARQQQRLEDAYVELLKMAERVGQWAQMVCPVIDFGGQPDTPLPSFEVQADASALMGAFGSEAVREKREAWESVVRKMASLVNQIRWEEADPTGGRIPQISSRATLHELRPDERAARQALADQVAVELRHGANP